MKDEKKTTTTKAKPTKQPPIEGDVIDQAAEAEPLDIETPTNEPTEQDQSALIQREVEAVGKMIGGISTDELRTALATQTEQRSIVKEFVQVHLVDGTDYGRIHVVKPDKCPNPYNCDKSYHYSKAVLFKPGQEKLFSLFQITDELERDEETYTMLPTVANLVAYKCTLYRNSQKIGEGRGSAVVGDNRRDVNATIKIAEKRARMDACLSLGFSEYFAQDLDDPDYKAQAQQANERVAAEAAARDTDEYGLLIRDAELPVNEPEKVMLTRLCRQRGYTEWDDIFAVLKLNGISDPQAMTSGQAKQMIQKLHKRTFAAPAGTGQDNVVQVDDSIDVDAALDQALSDPQTPTDNKPAVQEAELVVDDDFKANITDLYQSIGFNSRGEMWFKKYVSGRPFGGFDKFTDEHWRKAFDLLQDILDERMPVEDTYLAGVITDDQPVVDPSEPKSRQLDNVQQAFPGAKDVTPDGEK